MSALKHMIDFIIREAGLGLMLLILTAISVLLLFGVARIGIEIVTTIFNFIF